MTKWLSDKRVSEMTDDEVRQLATGQRSQVVTVTKTQTACRVVDQILHWTDSDGNLLVQEGDLILRDYRMEVVDRLYYNPTDNILVRVELAGYNAATWAQPNDLVAVRRYITEETP